MTVQQQRRAVTVTTPGELEIHFERIFDAPRDLVWKTFTDPALIEQWWGGGTSVGHMDVRTGGSWRFLAKTPQGEVEFKGDYLAVEPPSRIVQTFQNGWMPGPAHTETLVFEDLGDSTRLTMTSVFETVERRDEILMSAEQGANYTYGKLDQLLRRLGQKEEAR